MMRIPQEKGVKFTFHITESELNDELLCEDDPCKDDDGSAARLCIRKLLRLDMRAWEELIAEDVSWFLDQCTPEMTLGNATEDEIFATVSEAVKAT